MSGLEVVGDISGMWQEGMANLGAGMGAIAGQETGDRFMVLADALDILSGSMAVASGVATAIQTINAAKAGRAVAETTAHALTGPIGWSRIALALGAMATASVIVGSITHYTIKGDLSSPSGRQAVTQTIGGIV